MSSRKAAKLWLYVPTKGRVDHQHTLQALPLEWHKRTIIVCPSDEIKAHKRNWPKMQVIAQGKEVKGIADARAWIFREAARVKHEKIVMLDDDIRFAVRKARLKKFQGVGDLKWPEFQKEVEKNPDLGRLVNLPMQDPRMNRMLLGLETMLNTYAHTGIHARLMSNRIAYEWRINTRIQQVYAYHVPTVMEHCVVGRKIMRDDFDYQLQLLTKGFECVVYCWVVGEQARGFHGKGGQDTSRTVALNDADAHRLAKLFPGLVKVVDREYNRMPRKEVIVYWRKAAEQGRTAGGLL